jgi:hypothetical protein
MPSPLPNEFALQIPSVADGTRPNTQFGTSITPATGSHGSYASLISGASVTEEVWGILINVNNVANRADLMPVAPTDTSCRRDMDRTSMGQSSRQWILGTKRSWTPLCEKLWPIWILTNGRY